MKKLLLAVLFCFCYNFGVTQCKFTKNEIDEFIGDRILETNGALLRPLFGNQATFFIRKTTGEYYFFLTYGIVVYTSVVIGKNDQLMLKLANGKVLSVYPTEVVTGRLENIVGTQMTIVDPVYKIDPKQVEILSNTKVEKIRLYKSSGYYEHKISAKFQEQLKTAFSCLFSANDSN